MWIMNSLLYDICTPTAYVQLELDNIIVINIIIIPEIVTQSKILIHLIVEYCYDYILRILA